MGVDPVHLPGLVADDREVDDRVEPVVVTGGGIDLADVRPGEAGLADADSVRPDVDMDGDEAARLVAVDGPTPDVDPPGLGADEEVDVPERHCG